MEIKFQNKIMLMSMFLCLFIFSGCYNTAVAVNQNDFSKTFNEYNLEEGNIYVTTDQYTIPGGNTIYVAGTSNGKDVSMYRRVARASSIQDIDIDIVLYEGGTQYNQNNLTTFNKNRNSNKTATFTISESSTNPLSITGATILPFANKLKADKEVLAESSDTADYIMKQNETYVLEITNNALQSVDLTLYWNWIELQ